jgi:phosphoribosylformylglycinamidine synthase
MSIPQAIVLAGNGTNCEIETAHACRLGGFEKVDIVAIWELLNGDTTLDAYDFLVLPGGFLDGDDLGSGKAQANRILYSADKKSGQPLIEQCTRFIRGEKLILGICNGFQLMIKLGLVPALDNQYAVQQATLASNDSGKFEDRWVQLKVNPASPCVFTRGLNTIYLPIRHGEGKFIARDRQLLDKIRSSNQATMFYLNQQTMQPTLDYPDNPNGSQAAIAGICDPTGRLFGLMPHPEAYNNRTNHPRWTRENVPEEGAGIALFRNAFEYLKSKAR